MTGLDLLPEKAALGDVLTAFPRNSAKLLNLLNDVMCAPGALSRAERELIAAYTSNLNATGYCVHFHTLFAEILAEDVEAARARLAPLMACVKALGQGSAAGVEAAVAKAREAGWSQEAIFEAVEVSGIFSYINRIVKVGGLIPPQADAKADRPTAQDLEDSYLKMARNLGFD